METKKYTLQDFDQKRIEGYRPGFVAVFVKDKKILFLYKKEYGIWMLPQGGIENKEELVDSMARVLPEEVGLGFVNSCESEFEVVFEDKMNFAKSKLGVKELKTDSGDRVEMVGKYFYYCLLNCPTGDFKAEDSVYDDHFWMSYQEATFVNNKVYQETKKGMTEKLLNTLLENDYIN